MTWFRVADNWATHPKFVGLSDASVAAWLRAMGYASQYLTDGHIPAHAAPIIGKPRSMAELVDRGLLDTTPEGWVITNYLVHQSSRDDVERQRENNKARAARSRASRAHVRERHSEVTEPDTDTDTDTEKNTSSDFARWWLAYPRKVGKRTAEQAYARALKRSTADDILAGTIRLQPAWMLLEQNFIPHPTTWLNRDGWLDDPPPAKAPVTRADRNAAALDAAFGARKELGR